MNKKISNKDLENEFVFVDHKGKEFVFIYNSDSERYEFISRKKLLFFLRHNKIKKL